MGFIVTPSAPVGTDFIWKKMHEFTFVASDEPQITDDLSMFDHVRIIVNFNLGSYIYVTTSTGTANLYTFTTLSSSAVTTASAQAKWDIAHSASGPLGGDWTFSKTSEGIHFIGNPRIKTYGSCVYGDNPCLNWGTFTIDPTAAVTGTCEVYVR